MGGSGGLGWGLDLRRPGGRGGDRRLGGCRAAAPAGGWDLGQIGLRREQAQLGDEALGEGVGVRVALEVTNGVGAADRVGLPKQVVAQRYLGIGIGAAHVAQRGACPGADLVGRNPQQGADVVVSLASLQQQLEHGSLFVGQRQERNSLGISSRP